MSVLSVQSVSYSYKTKYQTVQAVKDVSCDLSAGTFYALVGKSGSGKTTLLSLLAGLDTPSAASAAELPLRRHNSRRPKFAGNRRGYLPSQAGVCDLPKL